VREDYHTFLNLTFQYVFNMEYKKKLGDCIILCPRHEVFNVDQWKKDEKKRENDTFLLSLYTWLPSESEEHFLAENAAKSYLLEPRKTTEEILVFLLFLFHTNTTSLSCSKYVFVDMISHILRVLLNIFFYNLAMKLPIIIPKS
jgi:hypothetical protein